MQHQRPRRRPGDRPRGVAIVAAGVALIVVAACSEPAPERSASAFAAHFAAAEEEPFDASSLADVERRSDDVVVGALTTVVRGPDLLPADADEIAPLGTSVIITIENEDGLHRIYVPRRVSDEVDEMAARAPIGARAIAMTVPLSVPDGTELDGAYADPDAVATMRMLAHPAALLVAEDGAAVPLFGSPSTPASDADNLALLARFGIEVDRIAG